MSCPVSHVAGLLELDCLYEDSNLSAVQVDNLVFLFVCVVQLLHVVHSSFKINISFP